MTPTRLGFSSAAYRDLERREQVHRPTRRWLSHELNCSFLGHIARSGLVVVWRSKSIDQNKAKANEASAPGCRVSRPLEAPEPTI